MGRGAIDFKAGASGVKKREALVDLKKKTKKLCRHFKRFEVRGSRYEGKNYFRCYR